MRWAGMWHALGRREMLVRYWWGNLKERAHLEDVGTGRWIILEGILKKWGGRTWIGFLWLRIR
jgi:hypothetical protein